MFNISLKILGLKKDYTFEELDKAYYASIKSNGDLEIITNAYNYLKEDLTNKTKFDESLKDFKENHDDGVALNLNLIKALEYVMDSNLREDIINFEINDLNDAIRYYELRNMYDALKEYHDSNYGKSKNWYNKTY